MSIMPIHSPAPTVPVRAEGVWLYEAGGTAWLDWPAGVATNALTIPGQTELAARLVGASFADTADNRASVAAGREQRLLLSGAGDTCARIPPPLALTHSEFARVAATAAGMTLAAAA